jgi:hypothetical protein
LKERVQECRNAGMQECRNAGTPQHKKEKEKEIEKEIDLQERRKPRGAQ